MEIPDGRIVCYRLINGNERVISTYEIPYACFHLTFAACKCNDHFGLDLVSSRFC